MKEIKTWDDIAAAAAQEEAAIAALERTPDKPPYWNRCYPVDIDLPMYVGTAAFGSFTIDADTDFYAKGIEAFYTINGTWTEAGFTPQAPLSLTLSEPFRLMMFDYTWMVRDTGSGGDWMNTPLPSYAMQYGNINGFLFGRGHRLVPGTSLVTVTINPTFFQAPGFITLETLDSHSLQVIVSGVSKRRGAA